MLPARAEMRQFTLESVTSEEGPWSHRDGLQTHRESPQDFRVPRASSCQSKVETTCTVYFSSTIFLVAEKAGVVKR